jgi:hypothetical protein
MGSGALKAISVRLEITDYNMRKDGRPSTCVSSSLINHSGHGEDCRLAVAGNAANRSAGTGARACDELALAI